MTKANVLSKDEMEKARKEVERKKFEHVKAAAAWLCRERQEEREHWGLPSQVNEIRSHHFVDRKRSCHIILYLSCFVTLSCEVEGVSSFVTHPCMPSWPQSLTLVCLLRTLPGGIRCTAYVLSDVR